jgi:hypothetical protein
MRVRHVWPPGPPMRVQLVGVRGLAGLVLVCWAPIAAAADITGRAQGIWASGIVLTSSLMAAVARPRR